MPGMVAFRRRWSVGSDDLVVPAIFLVILHTAWILVLALIRALVYFEPTEDCTKDLRDHILGYIVILAVCVVLEVVIAWVSMRGTILSPEPRSCMEYILYVRLVMGFLELAWLIVGAVWSAKHYQTCQPDTAKRALLVIMVINWTMMLICVITVWCAYDTAGAKWVKMKKFQDSLKERRQRQRRQSGSRRNWRQRKAFRAYEESWDRRLQLLCCCVERKGRNKNSMTEIAQLFTDFFRDLDVVPSDIIAGLVLLRHHQKNRMKSKIAEGTNDVYQYLSGVPITPNTQFLQLTQPEVMGEFIKVIHYMRFALAAYGWPVYVMMNPCTWFCRLLPMLSCCCGGGRPHSVVLEDNCCGCNVASLKRISSLQDLDIVYATYHVDIGETPFYVALDHEFGKVVVCVRGTLSLQDVLTDLKAEPETLPLHPPRDEWQGHKGMVQAALYIKKKLIEGKILDMAWERDEGRDVAKYDLVCVGHSLGAGTAAILAILLKEEYPNLHCYAFSPPGGLLTLPCVEATKSYITSVVVGKDVVPRIGLSQLEMLRTDIINLIKSSRKSKWNIISKGFCCCGQEKFFDEENMSLERDVTAHPSNSAIGLSAHMPLYPPGKVIHVVRSHATDNECCKPSEPIYQALWAGNGDFDEVLVSPTMVNDHMPDNVLDSLEKVLQRVGPQKPMRTMTDAERQVFLSQLSQSSSATPSPSQAQGFLETSFTPSVPMRQQSTGGLQRNTLSRSWDQAAEQILQSQGAGDAPPECFFSPDDVMTHSTLKPQLSLPLSSEAIHAPLASPETLSMASGILMGSLASGVMGSQSQGLSQSDSLRDTFRRSLNSPPPVNPNKRQSGTSSPAVRVDSVHVDLSAEDSSVQVDTSRQEDLNKSGTPRKQDRNSKNTNSISPAIIHDQTYKTEKHTQNTSVDRGVSGSSENSPNTRSSKNSGSTSSPGGRNRDSGRMPRLSEGSGDHATTGGQTTPDLKQQQKRPDFERNAQSQASSDAVSEGVKSGSPTPGNEDDSNLKADGIGSPHSVPNNISAGGNVDSKGSPTGSDMKKKRADVTVAVSSSNPHDKDSPPSQLESDVARLPTVSTTCIRHSPVTETTQGEYEHPNLHYSSAGTGYPHGAYHPPIRYSPELNTGTSEDGVSLPTSDLDSSMSLTPNSAQSEGGSGVHPSKTFTDLPLKTASQSVSGTTPPPPHPFVHCQSESSIFSKHFPPKLGMKRSAERSDICHLEDEAEVFPSPSDLHSIKRSAEQTDIAHLGDDLDVFDEGDGEMGDTVGKLSNSRSRLAAIHSTPRSSVLSSKADVGSRTASSSHSSRSDDVFESEGNVDLTSETDV